MADWLVVCRSFVVNDCFPPKLVPGKSWAWSHVEDIDTSEEAEQDIGGTIEAGGNIWDTPSGWLPPDEEDDGYYEVVAAMDVTGMSDHDVESLYHTIKLTASTTDLSGMTKDARYSLYRDMATPAEILLR